MSAHGAPELQCQHARQQGGGQHQGIGAAEHDPHAEQGQHRSGQGNAPENVARHQGRPERALGAQGGGIVFRQGHGQHEKSGAIDVVGRVAHGPQPHPEKHQKAQAQRDSHAGEDVEHGTGLHRGHGTGAIAGNGLLRPEAQNGGGLADTGSNGQHCGQRQAKGEMAVFLDRHGAREHDIGEVGEAGGGDLDAQRADRAPQAGMEQGGQV